MGERLFGFFAKEHFSPEEERLSSELRGFYRQWDLLEKNGAGSIIDFDLAPYSPEYEAGKKILLGRPLKAERALVLSTLEEYLKETDQTRFSSGRQKDYLLAKLAASHAYARRINGEAFDPFEYIYQVDGVRPTKIPEGVIDEQKQKVANILREAGCQRYDAESLQEFFKSLMITDSNAITTEIKSFGDQTLVILGHVLDDKIRDKLSYKTEVVQKDAYWLNWTDGDIQLFILQINNHPSHRLRWIRGKPPIMGVHEIGSHFGGMIVRAERIAQKKLLPIFGVTTVFEPEEFISEGVAQALPFFLEDELRLPKESMLALELDYLRQLVYNNVHVAINSPDFSKEKIAGIKDYIWQFLPTEPEEVILREIEHRTTNPKLQAYQYVYGYSFYLHRLYAQSLSYYGKREFLKAIFESPMTPVQEFNVWKDLFAKPQFRSRGISQSPEWLSQINLAV
ncbi:MAG: hypothetical protein AAB639_03175 [Patescibacteria group bacterium]